jgi:C4-dicarboxylate transporter, DctM subunit
MFSRILDRLEELIISLLIGLATLIIFVAVIHRYGAGMSADLAKWAAAQGYAGLAANSSAVFKWASNIDMSWAQELCIYMFVWMAKFGAAYGVRQGVHVGVDVFVNMIAPASRRPVIVFTLLCGALFTAVVGSLGAHFVWEISRTGQQSNDLEVPMWIVYLAVPLGSYLMCFRFLQVAVSYWRTGELPHHDQMAVAGMDDIKPMDFKTAEARS